MKLSKNDILNAVRKFNETVKEDKHKQREQLERHIEAFLAKGGEVKKVPTGATTTRESPYGYGYRATQFRNSIIPTSEK